MRRESMSIGELYLDSDITGPGAPLTGIPYTTGKRWFVDTANGVDSTGEAGTKYTTPFATLDYAIGRCEDDKPNQIICMEGSEETVGSAGDIAIDVSDIEIVGLGFGSRQAKITFDTADTADIDISADNITFRNIWFEANFANVDGAIDVAATGDYLSIIGCRLTASGAALDFEEFINLAAGANYFSFIGNDVHMIEGTDGESLVLTAGESLGLRVIGNNIVMEASTSIFDCDATALTGGPIFRDNFMVNLTAAADYCVEIDATTVAHFCNERYGCAGAAIPVNDGSASFFVNCQGVDGVNQSSLIFPKTATAWP